MEKRRIGSSDLEIAPLVLGGNVFDWTADEQTSFAILDAFVDAGGTMIDTADVYSMWVEGHSGGESETVIGRWLKARGNRERVQIATKVGFMSGLSPEAIRSGCEASLKRLNTDVIDLYYHHKDDESVPLADSLGAMEELRRNGKIREIGLSQYAPERLRAAAAAAVENGFRSPCALQTWYNLVERAKLEGPLLEAAADGGMDVIPFYALANGFLTGKYRSRDDLTKSVRGIRNIDYLEGKGQRVLAVMDEIAAETGAALGTIALAWTLDQPHIAGVLASATSVEQLRESLAVLDFDLKSDQLERLSAASAEPVPA